MPTQHAVTTHRTAATASLGHWLFALAALCATIAFAPHATAQNCGASSLSLAAEEWTLVGVPCVPVAPNNTVATFFGPDLDDGAGGNNSYNLTWVLWRKGYDPVTCAGKSDPDNCYVKMAASDTVSAGDAFWLYTVPAKTLTFAGLGATATSGQFDYAATLAATLGGDRYYLFANPFEDAIDFADWRWTGNLVFFGNFDRSTEEATFGLWLLTNGIVHYWNGNSYDVRTVTGPDSPALFEPKESAWVEHGLGFIPAFFLNGDVTVEVPDPSP